MPAFRGILPCPPVRWACLPLVGPQNNNPFCHPEGISPKDPMDFNNNWQSLLCMGFFPARWLGGVSLRMTKIRYSE